MLKQTKYLGETEIDEDKVIRFSQGLPGFPDEKEFAILDLPGNDVFHILQSLNVPEIAFIITNPYQFRKDYSFNLDSNFLDSMSIEKPEDVAVFVIVTIREPFSESTLNLKAPIIVHAEKKEGKQFILNTDQYATKTPITSQNMNNETNEGGSGC